MITYKRMKGTEVYIYLCDFFSCGPYVPEVNFLAILSNSNGFRLKINVNLKSTNCNVQQKHKRNTNI